MSTPSTTHQSFCPCPECDPPQAKYGKVPPAMNWSTFKPASEQEVADLTRKLGL